jgi:hypothetical protein
MNCSPESSRSHTVGFPTNFIANGRFLLLLQSKTNHSKLMLVYFSPYRTEIKTLLNFKDQYVNIVSGNNS